MTLIALEASTRVGSVAVLAGDQLVTTVLDGERAHASDLLSAVDRLLTELGVRPHQVRGVLVGIGPGSFTGLRVAVATAMGIARGANAGARGVSSLEALLFAELEPGEDGCVVLDARARELYFAHYRREEDDVVALVPPRVQPIDAPLSLPTGARIFGDAVEGLSREVELTLARPTAEHVLELGARRLERLGPEAVETIEPLYLRPFAAKRRAR